MKWDDKTTEELEEIMEEIKSEIFLRKRKDATPSKQTNLRGVPI